jgi:putative AbiEi antitoxin of type IV toxin-antitoxin system
MPRSAYNTIVDIAAQQQGYVTQQDARGAGIAATTLARMAERATLVRTSHGVYRVPLILAGPLDRYMEATLWPRGVRGVLSNETALGLYDFSDVNPTKIHITVPRAHRPQRETPRLYVVHRADLRHDEITAYEGERPVGRANDRFRDLLDLLVLRDLIDDLPALRRACETTFASRATHAWPPSLEVPPTWRAGYARLACSEKYENTRWWLGSGVTAISRSKSRRRASSSGSPVSSR